MLLFSIAIVLKNSTLRFISFKISTIHLLGVSNIIISGTVIHASCLMRFYTAHVIITLVRCIVFQDPSVVSNSNDKRAFIFGLQRLVNQPSSSALWHG